MAPKPNPKNTTAADPANTDPAPASAAVPSCLYLSGSVDITLAAKDFKLNDKSEGGKEGEKLNVTITAQTETLLKGETIEKWLKFSSKIAPEEQGGFKNFIGTIIPLDEKGLNLLPLPTTLVLAQKQVYAKSDEKTVTESSFDLMIAGTVGAENKKWALFLCQRFNKATNTNVFFVEFAVPAELNLTLGGIIAAFSEDAASYFQDTPDGPALIKMELNLHKVTFQRTVIGDDKKELLLNVVHTVEGKAEKAPLLQAYLDKDKTWVSLIMKFHDDKDGVLDINTSAVKLSAKEFAIQYMKGAFDKKIDVKFTPPVGGERTTTVDVAEIKKGLDYDTMFTI